jgi:hypothetical protein
MAHPTATPPRPVGAVDEDGPDVQPEGVGAERIVGAGRHGLRQVGLEPSHRAGDAPGRVDLLLDHAVLPERGASVLDPDADREGDQPGPAALFTSRWSRISERFTSRVPGSSSGTIHAVGRTARAPTAGTKGSSFRFAAAISPNPRSQSRAISMSESPSATMAAPTTPTTWPPCGGLPGSSIDHPSASKRTRPMDTPGQPGLRTSRRDARPRAAMLTAGAGERPMEPTREAPCVRCW